ncbi:CAP domain-containing protein [Streptomyces sp. NPDC051172]|uniref:CAP domain-containing protein n=1 Tax=Streptomyces sp. NPDC051172 TaxID=3155796 RepID=UPI00343EB3CC
MGSDYVANISGKAMIWASVTAMVGAAAIGGGAMLNVGSAEPAALGAAFSRTSEWGTGYTARYVVTNNTKETKRDWSLEFDVPQGAQITAVGDTSWPMNGQRPEVKPPQWGGHGPAAGEGNAAWTMNGQRPAVKPPQGGGQGPAAGEGNASWTMNGQRLTVKPGQGDADGLAAGESTTVGFVVQGTTADPTNCSIDGSPCSSEGGGQPVPTGSAPTSQPPATTTASPSVQPPATTTAPPTIQPPATTTAPPASQTPEPTGSAPTAPADTVAQVVALVNKERAAAGCGPLTEDAQLEKAAQGHSDDMAARNFYDHTNPDGVDPWQRIHAAGYPGGTLGENIAKGNPTPQDVMDAWMNSPEHRANILNCSFEDIGVGVNTGPGGPWWTQDFGVK